VHPSSKLWIRLVIKNLFDIPKWIEYLAATTSLLSYY